MTEQRPPRDSGPDDELYRRPYRPGRGGFDPEAAALAARARYAFRQRVVSGLLMITVASVALAFIVTSSAWWAVVGAVVALAGYLAYLRRQVHIEEEVRRRRAARLGAVGARRAPAAREEDYDDSHSDVCDCERYDGEDVVDDQQSVRGEAVTPAALTPPPLTHPRAVVVDLDDEDPAFAELDPTFEPPYRRAVGE